MAAFVRDSGHADRYAALTVNYINHHNPDLFLFNAEGQEIQKIDLTRLKTTANIHKLLKMLMQRHERAIAFAGHCDAMRAAVKTECPEMDDDFIIAAVQGMKVTGTWWQCGEWSRQINARLGSV